MWRTVPLDERKARFVVDKSNLCLDTEQTCMHGKGCENRAGGFQTNSPDNGATWPYRNRDAIGERNPHRGKRQDQFARLQISALETIFGKR